VLARVANVPDRHEQQEPAQLGQAIERCLPFQLELAHLMGPELARECVRSLFRDLEPPGEFRFAPLELNALDGEVVEVEVLFETHPGEVLGLPVEFLPDEGPDPMGGSILREGRNRELRPAAEEQAYMVSTLAHSAALRSFRLATPVRRTSTPELTTIAVLTGFALALWALVLPLELVFLAT
jgi:hypothetical protein